MFAKPRCSGSSDVNLANEVINTVGAYCIRPYGLVITTMLSFLINKACVNTYALSGENAKSHIQRKRLALVTTVTEDKAIAAPAIIGFNKIPNKG